MNLKKCLLMTLLLTVLMLTLSAQTSNKSKTTSDNELGIDLTKTYSGQEVQAIIDIILEEADVSIEKAYKEGYKQATVELKPEIIYWQTRYNSSANTDFTTKLKIGIVSFGSGFLVGGYSGYMLGCRFPFN